MSLSLEKKQSGNALFLILIAVALFAALSFVVTTSTRSSGNTISREQAKLQAAEIMNYTAMLRAAVTRMLLTGTTIDTIAFNCLQADGCTPQDTFSSWSDIPSTLWKDQVFHQQGGGVSFRNFSFASGHQIFTADMQVLGLGKSAPPPSAPAERIEAQDLLFFLGGLSKEMCEEINRLSDVSGIPTDAGIIDFAVNELILDASFSRMEAVDSDYMFGRADVYPDLYGKTTACFASTGGPWIGESTPYFFLGVLAER